MVFKKEKSIMKEKESDQEGVIKVTRYGKCFIPSKEFICTNILQTKIERLLNYVIIISFEEFQKKKKNWIVVASLAEITWWGKVVARYKRESEEGWLSSLGIGAKAVWYCRMLLRPFGATTCIVHTIALRPMILNQQWWWGCKDFGLSSSSSF